MSIGMTLPGGYEITERTRFEVHITVSNFAGTRRENRVIKGLRTLVEVQTAYIEARNGFDAGASRFGEGEVIDEMGQTVARVSYNGRLWPAGPWFPGQMPLAEAPK